MCRSKAKSVTSIAVLCPCRDCQNVCTWDTGSGVIEWAPSETKTLSLKQQESTEIHRKKGRALTLLAKKPKPNQTTVNNKPAKSCYFSPRTLPVLNTAGLGRTLLFVHWTCQVCTAVQAVVAPVQCVVLAEFGALKAKLCTSWVSELSSVNPSFKAELLFWDCPQEFSASSFQLSDQKS